MKSSPTAKILIIEDEVNIAQVIEDYFMAAGYTTKVVHDGYEGLTSVETFKPSLIVLDIMLPGLDGFSICKRVRKTSAVPIIMLTARTDVEDQLFGYELKVDDYMSKPFNPEVLVAKAGNLIERAATIPATDSAEGESKTSGARDDEDILEANGIQVHLLSREVYVGGQRIDLENKQFEILRYFCTNPNIVLTREKIMDQVWGYDYVGTSRAVDAQITKLRQKLKHKAYCIKTEFGVGYKFEVNHEKKHRL